MNVYVILNLIIAVGILETCFAKGFDKDKLDDNEKLRLCIVERRGAFKNSGKYCPILEASSNIECVIGTDRLDCLRRIHKGSAHFGVFTSEELVAAQWAGVEVLVTSELRFHDTPFEYELVVVVDNEANIGSAQELRDSRLCHPGHGIQSDYTEVLANYLESTLVARQCEADLSLTESRIKASANFFGPTCKAGPWVPDPIQDQILKKRYPSLCELCDNPYRCGIGDKHWGRRGPLYCLTSGAGQVAWLRLDDVRSHFGFEGLTAQSDPASYSYLCPDGHLQPLNSTRPCIWVAKPWSAIAAKRDYAVKVQELLSHLSHDNEESWENALFNLIESYHVNVKSLDFAVPIDDFLSQAVGFQSAYSFPACKPPRSIIFCTTSLIQHAKCSWLQEASSVYGIEPNLQCIRAENLDRCLDDTKQRSADVVLVNQDDRARAERDFNLRSILFEYSPELEHRYSVIAVVKSSSNIRHFSELRGKRACFPKYEGAAYLSVTDTIRNQSLTTNTCHYSTEVEEYFASDSCTWGNHHNCDKSYRGDEGALNCLANYGDVAFVSVAVFKNFTQGGITKPWSIKLRKSPLEVLCPFGKNLKANEYCYMHWAPHGHIMIHNDTEIMRRNEIYNSLRDMDRLFGKHYKAQSVPFTMYGPFDRKFNVIFRDTTDGLKSLTELTREKYERHLEPVFTKYMSKTCKPEPSSASSIFHSLAIVFVVGLVGIILAV